MNIDLSQTMTQLAQTAGQALAAFIESLTVEQANKLSALLEAGGHTGADISFGTDGLTTTLYLRAPDGQAHVLHQHINPALPARH